MSEFEIEFNARVGDSATREAEAAAARADRPQEIWIAQDGKLSSGDYANIADHRAIHALRSVSTVEVLIQSFWIYINIFCAGITLNLQVFFE